MMRVLVLLVPALLLAGCAAPGEDKDEDDPLFGLCPQWAQGPGGTTGTVQLDGAGNVTRELGPAADKHLDRPLDLFRVTITGLEVDGTLELRASDAKGERLTLRDYRLGATQMVPVVTLGDDAMDQEFDVFLSAVLHDAPKAQLPAALEWRLDGAHARVDYNVTYHYKVCGS